MVDDFRKFISKGRIDEKGRVGPSMVIYPHKEKQEKCKRGHRLVEPNQYSSGACKSCQVTIAWANRNNLFHDDPRVMERSWELYRKYVKGTAFEESEEG